MSTSRGIRWAERAGDVGGLLLAPVTAAISRIRHARMFHPDGRMYRASVRPCAVTPELDRLAERLQGPAIVRLSSAWWRGEKQWRDALGMAVRFVREAQSTTEPKGDDQDLLLATIRFPLTLPFAPFATNVKSYLWNHFHGVSPFESDGVGRVKIRARSPRLRNDRDVSREDHLAWAVAARQAVYTLEARKLDRPVWRRRWEPIAELRLEQPIELDQSALRFSPFRSGRGLEPVGFVHHLRIAAYAASQRARGMATT
ncbi:hypothetical protein LZC95_34105 [Pendulispora brunnea]|uniref:Uncharacterized protein n=1 Tax=Pendulispora brunnea TaxID=2905690 RepID=A0ABZ2K3W0_9BACT